MHRISADLADPAWWFTAFIMAIITGLVAGFLKDIVAGWLSRSSTWFKARATRSAVKEQARVKALASHPQALVVYGISMTVTMLLFLWSGLNFLFIPVWTDLMNASPAFRSWLLATPEQSIMISKLLIIVYGMMGLVTGFSTTSRIRTFAKARDILNKTVGIH